MEFLYELIVVVHLLGMAAIVGGYLTVLKAPRVVPGMVHGALTQVLTGLILVGMREGGSLLPDEEPLNHPKIGLKLLIALAVAVLAWTNRRREHVSPTVVHLIGGLAMLNVAVAALWT